SFRSTVMGEIRPRWHKPCTERTAVPEYCPRCVGYPEFHCDSAGRSTETVGELWQSGSAHGQMPQKRSRGLYWVNRRNKVLRVGAKSAGTRAKRHGEFIRSKQRKSSSIGLGR